MSISTSPKMGGRAQLRLYGQTQTDTTSALTSLPSLVNAKYGDRVHLELITEPGAPACVARQAPAESDLPDAPPSSARALLDAQFGGRLWQCAPDIIILSLLPDLCYSLWQNSRTGRWLALPPEDGDGWHIPLAQAGYTEAGLPTAAQFRAALLDLIQAIKERLDAHVLVFNASSIIPGDRTFRFFQQPDTPALRIHKFNLALIDVSIAEGISIIDVDRLVADAGGVQQVSAPLTYRPAVQQALAQEALRVLEDIGFFEERPLLQQVGQGKK